MKVVVFGATGTIGEALVPVLAREHDVVAVSRSERPAEGAVAWKRADATDGGVGARGPRRRRRRLLPRPLARLARFRAPRPRRSRDGRTRGGGGGHPPDRLPGRARRRLARALAAPAQPHRDRSRARLGQRAGDHAARRHGRRRRQRGVRDDSRARRSPARDDLPALGLDADPAHRARRRRRVPRGGLRPRGVPRRELRRRRPRRHDLPPDDRADRSAARTTAADRRGSGAHAPALLLLAPPGHARRCVASRAR